jgi:hypothetical protein
MNKEPDVVIPKGSKYLPIGVCVSEPFDILCFSTRTDISIRHEDVIKSMYCDSGILSGLIAYTESKQNKPVSFPSLMHLIVACHCKNKRSIKKLLELTSEFDNAPEEAKRNEKLFKKWKKHDRIGALAKFLLSNHQYLSRYSIIAKKSGSSFYRESILDFSIDMLLKHSKKASRFKSVLKATDPLEIYYVCNSGYSLTEGARLLKSGLDGNNFYGKAIMRVRARLNKTALFVGSGLLTVTVPIGPLPSEKKDLLRSTTDSSCVIPIPEVGETRPSTFKFIDQSRIGVYKGFICFKRCINCYESIASPQWEKYGPLNEMFIFCKACEASSHALYPSISNEKRRNCENELLRSLTNVESDASVEWKMYKQKFDYSTLSFESSDYREDRSIFVSSLCPSQ